MTATKGSKAGADPFGAALDSTLGEQYAAGTITLTELNVGASDIAVDLQTPDPPPPIP